MSSFLGSVPIGIIIISILFCSAMAAMGLARLLPEHHLNGETRSVVSVSVAVVGTLSALVVGLLISTSATSFNTKTEQVTQMSANIINLDRTLRRYGPEAGDARARLHGYTAAVLHDLFPTGVNETANLENIGTIAALETLQDEVLSLKPADPAQTWLQSQALSLISALTATRWELAQESANRMPWPLLVLVICWFVVIFASFGLFSPFNPTTVATIFLCAMAIGTAIRMTTELQTPFSGLVRTPSGALTQAMALIGQE